jgi:hypothetical protein
MLRNSALEAETAIAQLPPQERDFYRKQVADRVENLHKREHLTHIKQAQEETNTAKSIRLKLEENNATIACADNGNTTHR